MPLPKLAFRLKEFSKREDPSKKQIIKFRTYLILSSIVNDEEVKISDVVHLTESL